MAVYTYFTLMVMLIVMLMVMLMVQHVVLHVRSSDADVLNLVRTGKYVCTGERVGRIDFRIWA